MTNDKIGQILRPAAIFFFPFYENYGQQLAP